ncbi:conserved protein of unknown function [Rhodovastum atsumiense]|uniref:EcsC family protein n=1 Tax=Rhodovastum atsumiense TaxID=504468 RepID=A0A5M6INR5_9PROT|nr:EcsC family protein [Rhodovastum atsumiense]KAA5609916.1 hypothetical protein F1189_21725 [Rhodovastum atsumiense]CAH2604531.1 conserved protein of unknown function [Rhodovastum atsumiense]
MSAVLPVPASRRGNACLALSDEDYAALQELAGRYLAARSGFTTFMEWAGKYAERGLSFLPAEWQQTLHLRAREALSWAWRQATLGMDHEPPARQAPPLFYRLLTTGSGAVTGMAGLPGVLVDLPASTLLVLRSLAAQARARGLDVTGADVQAACLEAFSYGGPTDEDDDADLAFWSARAAVPMVAEMLPQVAGRLSGRLAVMLPARAVPVISVAAGAGVNWHFTGYFQEVGDILLALLPMERRYGRAQLRACFEAVLREQRVK